MNLEQAAQILEISLPVKQSALKSAYREALLIWHPDRFEGNISLKKKADGRTQLINEAYLILKSVVQDDNEQDMAQCSDVAPQETAVSHTSARVLDANDGAVTSHFGTKVSLVIVIALAWIGYAVLKTNHSKPSSSTHTDLFGQKNKGCVWVVDRAEREGKLFLCGTIHILRASDYPLAPGYDIAYLHASRLIFELPPGASSTPEFQTRLMELGQYPNGESLEASVGPAVWKNLQAWAGTRSMSLTQLNRFRPWLASLVITSTEYSALGAKADRGVDQHFEQRASQDHKPGEGLETIELQFQLFSQLTSRQQVEMLEQTLAEVSTLPQEYEKMISSWKEGELNALHALLTREAEKYPELMEIFINRRNHAWIDRLDALLKTGDNAMLLVGAGHLGGDPDGVLSLLRQRGYRVRHVTEMSPSE